MAQGERNDDKAPKRPNLRSLPLPDPPKGAPNQALGRRAEAVLAVTVGFLTLKQACREYGMTEAEFLACEDAIKKHGWLALQDEPDPSPRDGGLMK